MPIKVIITGATGMVGEGVLLECLENPNVSQVLIINRKPYDVQHPKLRELLLRDFSELPGHAIELQDYDACFFCAGVSSLGMSEEKYTAITYHMTLAFARTLEAVRSDMVFTYVSGSHTDSSESGRVMWARVKGRTENDLMRLAFKAVYNFRPGVMLPVSGQKNWKTAYAYMAKMIRFVAPKSVLPVGQVAQAMINVTVHGYSKHILEIEDIRKLAVV